MTPGSVIVDLAAEAGGNCALTERDEDRHDANGVTIVGTTNLPVDDADRREPAVFAQRAHAAHAIDQGRQS